MHKNILRVSCICIVLFSISPLIPKAHGDGFAQENLPAASIGDRKISLFVKINPPIITSETSQDRYLLFRWFDANTNQTILHTTFLVEVTRGNQFVLRGLFHTHSGIITLKVTPSNDPQSWKIIGAPQPFLDRYMYIPQNSDTIDLVAPMLGVGGLYHIYVTLITIDNDQNIFQPIDAPRFEPALSVGDVSNHTVTYQGNLYNTTIISYYDKISDFKFDQTTKQFLWSMPFDWNTTRIASQQVFVHEEVRVPKSFKEFSNTPTYAASVNGNPIIGRGIIVDPYSLSDKVIAHILLNKADILKLAKNATSGTNSMNFTLVPIAANVKTTSSMVTDFGGFEIKLGWPSAEITANSKNNLNLTFSDVFTEQRLTGNVIYDLKILDKDGSTVLMESNQTAKGGTDIRLINLPSNGIYSIQVSVKSIINNGLLDTSRSGIARGNLVIPTVTNQETVPEFPAVTIPILVGFVALLVLGRIKNQVYR